MVEPTPTANSRYPAIDGMRSLAVMAVLVTHLSAFPDHGQYAVSLILTGSGVLIGLRTMRRIEGAEPVAMGQFWLRRMRRIFPPLLITLILALAWAIQFGTLRELQRTTAESWAAIFGVLNLRQIVSGDPYRALSEGLAGTEHLWTVSIEEQFYLFWSLIVLGVVRLAAPRRIRTITIASVLAIAWAVAAGIVTARSFEPTQSYLRPDIRMAEFFVGVLLAVLLVTDQPQRRGWSTQALDFIGLAAFVVTLAAWILVDFPTAVARPWSFVVIAGVHCLWVLPLTRNGWFAKAFSWAPLAIIGRRSYGLYVYSVPIFLWVSQRTIALPAWSVTVLRLAALALVTEVSYRFVELPIREHGLRTVRTAIPAAASVAAVVALLGVATATDRSPDSEMLRGEDPYVREFSDLELGALPTDSDLQRLADADRDDTVVMVEGESLAANLAHGLQRTAPDGYAVFDRTQPGCPMWSGSVMLRGQMHDPSEMCAAPWQDRLRSHLERVRPDVVVAWLTAPSVGTQVIDGVTYPAGDPSADAVDRAALEEFLDIVASAGAAAVLVGLPPVQVPAEDLTNYAAVGMGALNDATLSRWNTALVDVAADRGVAFVPTATVIGDPRGGFAEVVDGRRVRSMDGVHLTPTGADRVAAAVWPSAKVAARAS